jgi:outer membrane protein OmpA-like peptidoglycan-associated protein
MKNSGIGMDLYLSEKSSGSWSKPERLEINTAKNEISPFLSENGDTLYFASNGLEGLGNYDIYYSTRNGSSNSWSIPINMGNVINSPDFDAYLYRKGNQLFWSSNRGAKDADIYFAEEKPSPTLSINVTKKDVSKFNGTDGEIDLTVISGTAPYKFKWSNGGFAEDLFQLRKGIYELEIVDASGQKVTRKIELTEPQPELRAYFRLPEVRFEFDSWKLSSTKDLDSLNLIAELLSKNPGMIIELISHTDSRGDEKSNMKLSENRAKAVYSYLVEKQAIDPRRMIPIGKGETEPLRYIDPATKQYITLTETYIDSYKNTDLNLFEELHQQNRRMEGRIISFDFNPNTAPAAPKEYLLQPR